MKNNEPVAWRYKLVEFSKDYWHLSDNLDDIKNSTLARIENPIIEPLYTHPAKTLTDEEIDSIGINNEGVLRLFYMIKGDVTGLQFKEALRDFARAILKKASEK